MSTESKILIVDDERHFSAMTKEYLESQDYKVELVHNPLDVDQVLRNGDFNLCILDVQMPGKSGLELADEISRLYDDMPFIFLTGKSTTEDKIEGLKLGAEDYITKPYSLQELTLRIQNVLKRSKREPKKTEVKLFIINKALQFNKQTRELTIDDVTHRLTTIENELLYHLLLNQGKVLSRDKLLKTIWSDNLNVKTGSLNVYITKLRKALKSQNAIEILSIHGVGYKLIVKSDA